MDNNQDIIENLKVICLCNNIKRGTIVKAIRDGCKTTKEVNKKLGTGGGDCKGERCQKKVREIVASMVQH